MKLVNVYACLAWATAASAFVIPDARTTELGASLKKEAEIWLQDGQDALLDSFDRIQDRARPFVEKASDIWEEGKTSLTGEHKETVLDFLLESKYFTKLAKVVKDDDDLVELLNSTSKHGLTLFAPPDKSIPDHHDDDKANFLAAFDLEHLSEEHRQAPPKWLLRAIVKYHVVPSYAYSFDALRSGYNVTLATALTSHRGYLHGEPQRLSLGLLGLGVKINVFSDIIYKYADQKFSNGIVHPISRPLLPPPNVMQTLWFAPQLFSTLTTALQKVNASIILEKLSKELTAFGPINSAWDALPPKALAFLFSPFGEKYLRGLLAYHVVPGIYIAPDYFHKDTTEDESHESALVNVLDRVLSSFRVPCNHAHGKHSNLKRKHIDDEELESATGKTIHHHYRVPTALTLLLKKHEDDKSVETFGDEGLDGRDFAKTLSALMSDDQDDDDDDDHHHGKIDSHLYIDTYRTIILPKFARLPRLVPAGRIVVNGQPVAVGDVVAKNGIAHAIGKVLIPKKHHEHDD